MVGLIYVAETLSDIIQVVYFKKTGGKRFFRMAPLHHHFELCGMTEARIVAMYTLFSIIMCLIALLAL